MVDLASLQQYSLFGGLGSDDMEKIRPLMGSAHYDAGAVILREGEPNDRIYFILEGRVEVRRGATLLVELGEGDVFGEMELIDVMPGAATVRALVPTRVATISNRTIHRLFHEDTRAFAFIVMNLARDLSRRLRRMNSIVAGC